MRRVVLAISLALMVVGLAAAPAMSALRPGFKLSKQIGSAGRSYPDPLIGTESSGYQGAGVATLTVYPSAANCASNTRRTCDTIDFDLVAPENPNPNEPYSIHFTLKWTSENNDVDLVIYDCTDQEARATCSRLRIFAQNDSGEESGALTNLPGKRYALVVVNVRGINNGYSLKTEWFEGKYVEFPRPRPEPSPTSEAPSARNARSSDEELPTSEEEEAEAAKLRAARSPGADGPLTTAEIAALGRSSEAASERGPWPWLALGLVVALGGVATFILIRRRRAAREEATP